MFHRVTSQTYATSAIHFSQLHGSALAKYQQQISSGLKFQRPSEDPISFRQATSLRARFEELSADVSSIQRASSILTHGTTQIQDFNDVVTSAKVLAQQGIQALDNDEREALATEVDGLLNQLKSIALSKFNDQFVFGGTKSDNPPFEFSEPPLDSRSLGVDYVGSDRRSRASVGEFISVDTYYNGLEIFGVFDRQQTEIFGFTGARNGAGTDTLTGRATLEVRHTLTTYAGASGVMPGTGSVGNDNVLGPSGTHVLTINDTSGTGASGTISLNGHEPVTFTSGDTNLEVPGPNGEVVFVDTTSIAAGFNGDVDIQGDGTLSVDEGATTVAIDFSSSSQVVDDSITQSAVTIDPRGIVATGNDQIEFPGTSTAFQVLHDLASDLRNKREFIDNSQLTDSLTRRLRDLEELSSSAFERLAEHSTSLSTLDRLNNRVTDLKNSVEIEVNEIQATNFPEAVLRLENSQQLLQYTYAVTGTLTSLRLIDFLR
jgi:flagellar hook-associated protein 3 FlgL